VITLDKVPIDPRRDCTAAASEPRPLPILFGILVLLLLLEGRPKCGLFHGHVLDLPRGLGVELLKVAIEVRLHFFVLPYDLTLQIHSLLIVSRGLDVRNHLVHPVAVLEAVPFDLLYALLIQLLE
jgi:hypothetical protein